MVDLTNHYSKLRVERQIWGLIACVSILGLCFILALAGPDKIIDPSYNGKPLSLWMRDLTSTRSTEDRKMARLAIQSLDTNAIPLFLKYLSVRDTSLQVSLSRRVGKLTGYAVPSEPILLRRQAVSGFEILGNRGRPAIARLTFLMTDESLAYDSACALGSMRISEAIPILRQSLLSSNSTLRAAGVAGAGAMRATAQPLLPELLELTVNDTDRYVRANAVEAISCIGSAQEVLPTIVDRLKTDESPMVRGCAASALSSFPENKMLFLEILVEASKSNNLEVRAGANQSLRKLELQSSVSSSKAKE